MRFVVVVVILNANYNFRSQFKHNENAAQRNTAVILEVRSVIIYALSLTARDVDRNTNSVKCKP